MKKYLLPLLLAFGSGFAAEQTIVIKTSEYKIKSHTDKHEKDVSRKIVTLTKKGEASGPEFWMDGGQNGPTLALLLTLMTTNNAILLKYDDQLPVPWDRGGLGGTAITSVESNDP